LNSRVIMPSAAPRESAKGKTITLSHRSECDSAAGPEPPHASAAKPSSTTLVSRLVSPAIGFVAGFP
jgi:hypothetical protein